MAILLYLARAISLLACLVSTSHRRNTLARWKTARPHRNVYEIGSGIIGLIILGALILLLVQWVIANWTASEP